MSFVERQINIEVKIGKGDFGQDGYDTVTLKGYRCSAQVQRAALPFLSQATIRICGMSPSLMNQLSTMGGIPWMIGRVNQITITAGDADAGMFQVFQGVINAAYQDYSGMPEVAFVAEAATGGLDLMKPATPTSHPGSVDVAILLKSLVARMTPPLSFENNGVSIILSTPYLSGTLIDQIRAVTRAANINAEIANGTLYIWPRNGTRPVAPTKISSETGLVGYPSFGGYGIIGMQTLFAPTVEFGGRVDLETSLQGAAGNWYVGQMSHDLESITPGGAWFTSMQVMALDYLQGQPSN